MQEHWVRLPHESVPGHDIGPPPPHEKPEWIDDASGQGGHFSTGQLQRPLLHVHG